MANFTFNVAKGRVNELVRRVATNDPANSAIVVVALATTGLESDATLIDKDTLADVLSGATNEVTNSGYARVVLTDADLTAPTPDDANDRQDADTGDVTFPAVAAGDAWSKVLFCYDADTTAGNDSNVVPLTAHDYTSTPDGSDIIVRTPNGIFRAS